MDKKNNFSHELADILKKVSEGKIYGSVEIYFEAGEITQITQRIINKVPRKKQEQPLEKKSQIEKTNTGKLKSLGKKNDEHEPVISHP